MRYIVGAFIAWILVRKRLAVYSDLVTKDASATSSGKVAQNANPS